MAKKRWLGALLNLIVPGLGNFYGRNFKKGLLHYVSFLVVVLSIRFIAYNFTLFLFSLTLIIGYYVYLIISGYRAVDQDKIYDSVNYDKWYVYVLILIFHWTITSSIKGKPLDKITPINFASIPTPAMDPGLEVGDILAFRKTKSIEKNDVTIFWHPDEINTMYVKRCIGMPGDSLQIKNGVVLVNRKPASFIPLKFKYLVTTDGTDFNPRILEKNHVRADDYSKMSFDTYQFFLTEQQANEFKTFRFVKSVELSMTNDGKRETMIYPKSQNFNWNTDFYGPIYIPKKGDQIQLTEKNMDFYLKCITAENRSVERDSSGVKINGQLTATYQFKNNYFFMMGDNRHNSLDSRYWGLLSQELVIGKAMYLYWGRTKDRIGKNVL